jgi:uncharacterized protein YegJ (DUF2314 family)
VPAPSTRPFWIVAAVLLGITASVAFRQRRRPEPAPARVTEESQGAPVEVGKRVPAGSLLGEHFRFEAAIYHLPRPRTDPVAALKRLLAGGTIKLQAGAPAAGEEARVWIKQPPIAEYAPPSAESLEFFSRGLSPEDKKQLAASKAVTMLVFEGPARDALPTYKRALTVVHDLREATGGLMWDEETRQIFTADQWARRSEDWLDGVPSVVPHITIHSYRDGELIRMITLGMVKFALPDVIVDQVAGSDSTSMATAIDLLCQTILEGAALREPGRLAVSLDGVKHAGFRRWATTDLKANARRSARLDLAIGKREKGDPANRLIAIVFPGPGAGVQARQVRLLDELFGAEDKATQVKHDDALLAASARAKKAVLAHKARYKDGPPLNEQLLVKAPFRTTSGGNEWMWVEVVRWRGNAISGVLRNDAIEVPGLRSGARVEVADDSLFDYLLVKPDGTREGGETSKLMEKQ